MTAYIHHVETLVPPYSYRQIEAREHMLQWLPRIESRRLIQRIYDNSGIENRFSVLPDFLVDGERRLFMKDLSGRIVEPSTKRRNDQYVTNARKLAVDVCRETFSNITDIISDDVTHVITASCTGFSNPGLDFHIVRDLDLPDSIERYHLGFMGCYAAFPALRMAQQFCSARPDAVVLIVCLELCTLHLQLRDEPDYIVANALFSDGVAAAVVSGRVPNSSRTALALHTFSSTIVPEGHDHLTWTIGDRGFNIRLSAAVPDLIAVKIVDIANDILSNSPWGQCDIGYWAVHPGGRAILDKLEKELGLAKDQISDSRIVLRDFGNMSSPTIFFILQRIMIGKSGPCRNPLCAMAFGPGLTIESALLERVPGSQ